MTMAHQDAWGGDTGLEDFNSSDVSMPRLTIDHGEGVFRDSLSNDVYEELEVVLLGLHKSRIMWPTELGDGDNAKAPMCKSPDFTHGFPNMDPDIKADDRFPWAAQLVYQPSDAVPLQLADGGETMPSIGCNNCRFKEWNTDPSGKKPWCSEEWTFPLAYLDSQGQWTPALFTVKRSGLGPAKKYVSPFASKKMPLFVVRTKLTLNNNKRGMVRYSTPVFTKGAETAQEEWPEYRDMFVTAKEFLKQLPTPRTEDDEAGEAPAKVENNEWKGETVDADPEPAAPAQAPASPAPAAPAAPPAQPAAPKADPAPAAPAVDMGDDDEPPF